MDIDRQASPERKPADVHALSTDDLICEARETGATLLDLSNRGLTQVPRELLSLSGLTHLDLSRNPLQDLPSFVSDLNLEVLLLNGTELTDLPGSLPALTRLERLELSGSRLRRIPNGIIRLPRLRKLSLARNALWDLPREIGLLAMLEYLDISENRFVKLPEMTLGMPGLLYLNVSGSAGLEIPHRLTSLAERSRLKSLWLDRNNLVQFPAFIDRIDSLEVLSVADN